MVASLTENYSVGGLLIGRTVAVLLTMTLSTSLAAREGPVPMAGHQLCLQVWLTISLLNDALALAGQVFTFTICDVSCLGSYSYITNLFVFCFKVSINQCRLSLQVNTRKGITSRLVWFYTEFCRLIIHFEVQKCCWNTLPPVMSCLLISFVINVDWRCDWNCTGGGSVLWVWVFLCAVHR